MRLWNYAAKKIHGEKGPQDFLVEKPYVEKDEAEEKGLPQTMSRDPYHKLNSEETRVIPDSLADPW